MASWRGSKGGPLASERSAVTFEPPYEDPVQSTVAEQSTRF
jgi:hypothetical protein